MEPFIIVSYFNVLVCTQSTCRHAVWPQEATRHLRGSKHLLKEKETRQIQERIDSVTNLARDSSTIVFPKNPIPRIDELPLHTNGLRCIALNCGYLSRSKHKMRNHCRDAHNEKRYGRRGRPEVGDSSAILWTEGISCQQLFPNRAASRLFEVRASCPSRTREADKAMQPKWGDFYEAAASNLSSAKADDIPASTTLQKWLPAWLERVRWQGILGGQRRKELLSLVVIPRKEQDHPLAWHVYRIGSALFTEAYDVACKGASVFLRFEVMRIEPNQLPNRPLNTYQDAARVPLYLRPWLQILLYFARGVPPKGTCLLNREQQKAWDLFAHAITSTTAAAAGNNRGEYTITKADRQRCAAFCLSLLDQQVQRDEFDCAFIHAAAVLGVGETGWKEPGVFSSTLSSLIKGARILLVYHVLQEERLPVLPRTALTDAMSRYMVRGTHGPMQYMIDLRRFALKIHYTEHKEGNIHWTGDTIFYGDVSFSLPALVAMVQAQVALLTSTMLQDVLLCTLWEEVPPIPWKVLRDSPSQQGLDDTVVTLNGDALASDGKTWLKNRVEQTGLLQRFQHVEGNGRLVPNRGMILQYLEQVQLCKERLLILSHITAGQPARGTEILSIQASNGSNGSIRNIYLEQGYVCLVTRYHKGYSTSGIQKIIHRYLPRPVGSMLFYYLWLIQPFEKILAAILDAKENASSFVWAVDVRGNDYSSAKLSSALRRTFRESMGQTVGLQAWREIAIAISRRFMKETRRFQNELDRNDPDEEMDNGSLREALDLQASHSSYIAETIYARLVEELDGATASKREWYLACSTEWHKLLGFASCPSSTAEGKKPDAASVVHKVRALQLMGTAPLAVLRRILEPSATFRGLQEAVAKAVFRGESPVVAIMPTGMGKSMSFILAAAASPTGLTVVITPLLELNMQLEQRCRGYGLSAATWSAGGDQRPPKQVSILFVTPESVLSTPFWTLMHEAKASGRLDRVVLDECHILVNGTEGFRGVTQRLGDLATLEVQMILLTGTLPTVLEAALWQRMSFVGPPQHLFRESTVRKEICYEVSSQVRATAERLLETVKRLRDKALDTYSDGAVLLFCNTIEWVERVAGFLGCSSYHGQQDRLQRRQVMAAFHSGRMSTLVGTSAVGMGLDKADVRCVIHVGCSYTFVDYMQETGRAGRDGRKAKAVLLNSPLVNTPMGTNQGRRDMDVYLKNNAVVAICRRRIIDRYMDGEEVESGCVAREVAMCDVCADAASRERAPTWPATNVPLLAELRYERQAKARSLQATQVREGIAGEEAMLLRVRRAVHVWTRTCALCMEEAHEEGLFGCRSPDAVRVRQLGRDLRTAIRFTADRCCFWCGLPRPVCPRWEEREQGAWRPILNGGCVFGKNEVCILLHALSRGGREGEWADRLQAFNVPMQDTKRLGAYLGASPPGTRLDGNGLSVELAWLTERHKECEEKGMG